MDTNTLLESARALLVPLTDQFNTPEAGRLDAYLPAEKIVEGVQIMMNAGGWHLSSMTGLDIPPTDASEGAIEVLYQFCQLAAVMTLRIQVPYGLPEAPSICGVIPSATLYERELIEMFGVIFDGTPVKDRLLLPDDWPDFVYPLRKSFKGLE